MASDRHTHCKGTDIAYRSTDIDQQIEKKPVGKISGPADKCHHDGHVKKGHDRTGRLHGSPAGINIDHHGEQKIQGQEH